MKASELISQIANRIKEHGDLEIEVYLLNNPVDLDYGDVVRAQMSDDRKRIQIGVALRGD